MIEQYGGLLILMVGPAVVGLLILAIDLLGRRERRRHAGGRAAYESEKQRTRSLYVDGL